MLAEVQLVGPIVRGNEQSWPQLGLKGGGCYHRGAIGSSLEIHRRALATWTFSYNTRTQS